MNRAVPVLEESRDGVAWIVLNRPEAAHALDESMADALLAALGRAAREKTVKSVVLSATGNRVLCAGIDLKNPSNLGTDELAEQRRQRVLKCVLAILAFEKPLVCALNGAAVGAGSMLALLADTIVAQEVATLSFPEIDIGLPTFLGFEILRQLGGDGLAADLVLSGRKMAAPEAHQRGLVLRVTDFSDLSAVAQQEALSRGDKPAMAYGLNKRWWSQSRRECVARAGEESRRVRATLHAAGEGFDNRRAMR